MTRAIIAWLMAWGIVVFVLSIACFIQEYRINIAARIVAWGAALTLGIVMLCALAMVGLGVLYFQQGV